MYKITVKGQARTSYPHLRELNGIECEDNFAEYFDDDFTFKDDVTNGYLHFSFENDKLYSVTTYDSTRELTPEELSILQDYTEGQWSDGIGEGFEQFPCKHVDEYEDEDGDETDEVYISPWFYGQVTTITQEAV